MRRQPDGLCGSLKTCPLMDKAAEKFSYPTLTNSKLFVNTKKRSLSGQIDFFSYLGPYLSHL